MRLQARCVTEGSRDIRVFAAFDGDKDYHEIHVSIRLVAWWLPLIVAGSRHCPISSDRRSSRHGRVWDEHEGARAIGREGRSADCEMHARSRDSSTLPADFKTVHHGMISDKSMPGMDEEEFAQQYGFGVSTLYTGLAPQLVEGYSPGRIGLGDQNVEIVQEAVAGRPGGVQPGAVGRKHGRHVCGCSGEPRTSRDAAVARLKAIQAGFQARSIEVDVLQSEGCASSTRIRG